MSLTNEHILELSRRLSDEYLIRKLGNRLGLQEHDIDAELEKSKDDKRNAALVVLKQWRRSQENQVGAHIKLCKALVEMELGKYATEALEYRSPGSV